MMEEYIESRIEDADKDDTALTNDVYFTDEGTVIKIYPKYPLTSIYASFVNFLGFKFSYLDRETRMRNEVEVKEGIRDAGLNAPEIVYRGESAIEFGRVPGVSGREYLNSCSEEEARELGVKVGEFLPCLHEKDIALRDLKITNLLVDEDSGIYLIDHEYASLDAGKVFKGIDYLTLFSSARQTSRYSEFREGFLEENGVGRMILFFSILTSIGHALLLERSWDRFMKSLASVSSDLRG